MAEFKKVVKEYKRMCDSTEYCKDCPLTEIVKYAVDCASGVFHNPEEAEDIIMQWATEHPIKTNCDKFREVFGMDLVVIGDTSKWLDEEYKEK